MTTSDPLLDISGLSVSATTSHGEIALLRGVDLTVRQGESVGIIGESGSGKTTTIRSVIDLLDSNVRIDDGEIRFRGELCRSASVNRLAKLRGREISMVFQAPTRALNPVRTVGSQLTEVIHVLRPMLSREERQKRACDVLDGVGFDDVPRILRSYPHQLSGGMCQRVGIAMALAPSPSLLIADEPTSALDVTTQAEVLHLLKQTVASHDLALVFVTHDLLLAADLCDDIVVMNTGEVVERGPSRKVLRTPVHPYSKALLAAVPRWQPRSGPGA